MTDSYSCEGTPGKPFFAKRRKRRRHEKCRFLEDFFVSRPFSRDEAVGPPRKWPAGSADAFPRGARSSPEACRGTTREKSRSAAGTGGRGRGTPICRFRDRLRRYRETRTPASREKCPASQIFSTAEPPSAAGSERIGHKKDPKSICLPRASAPHYIRSSRILSSDGFNE